MLHMYIFAMTLCGVSFSLTQTLFLFHSLLMWCAACSCGGRVGHERLASEGNALAGFEDLPNMCEVKCRRQLP